MKKLKITVFKYLNLFRENRGALTKLILALAIIGLAGSVIRIAVKGNSDEEVFANTNNPRVAFSKYDKQRDTYKETTNKLDKAMQNNQYVTLVFMRHGCADCKKWEGNITHYYYQNKHIKSNKTKYVMVDVNDLNAKQLHYFAEKIPSNVISPTLKTPTVVNMQVSKDHKHWITQDAFVENGTKQELARVFANGVHK